jgi:hypothetical protein
MRAGASIVAAYSASKFAIRGLTQAAGMSFTNYLPLHSWIEERLSKRMNSANMASL